MKNITVLLFLAFLAPRAPAMDAVTLAPISASIVAISFLATQFHSADTNHDSRISLTELLRVIELYNTRNGSVRTGSYVVDDANLEDGFNTDAARSPGATVTLARYHSADSNHDGSISLTELLRVIELYNYRSGTVRTGQYHVQSGTEDGFDPGPAALPLPPMPAAVLPLPRDQARSHLPGMTRR